MVLRIMCGCLYGRGTESVDDLENLIGWQEEDSGKPGTKVEGLRSRQT